MNAIESDALIVRKGKTLILSDLQFAVKAGTITGLVGPSGSGKTTLMRTIVGVQRLSSGTLAVLGQPAGTPSLRSKIGYVTQSAAVYPDLTVEENLRYFATIYRASRHEVDDVIAKVRLSRQRRQLVESLSGGQKARVSLAVALMGKPAVLVLDEPTVGLDPVLRNELWQLFRELADSGATLLVSSHVMDEADRCDDLLLLRDGKMLWNDTRRKLLDSSHSANVGEAFLKVIEGGKSEHVSR